MAQKLFIGGLSFSTSDERLRELFAAAGTVESAAVVTDRDTGRSRGFGFVEMSTAEEAAEAVKKFNGQEVDGRTLLGFSARLSPPENEQLGRNSGLDTVPSGLFGRLEVRKSPIAWRKNRRR